jgi:hypothetical protein
LPANERSIPSEDIRPRRIRVKQDVYNSKGVHVGLVIGPAIFDLSGKMLYELKGTKIYRVSGELIGHLYDTSVSEGLRLDKAADRLFA